MKEYLNRKCKIHLNVGNIDLFYTAKINKVTKTHVSFTDKFGIDYMFRITDIIQVHNAS